MHHSNAFASRSDLDAGRPSATHLARDLARALYSGRRLGLREPTRFLVFLQSGDRRTGCTAVELSATGVVLEHRGGWIVPARPRFVALELHPGADQVVRTVAQPVRRLGPKRYAFRFVAISDADRLSLVERLDRDARELARLLGSLEAAAAPTPPH